MLNYPPAQDRTESRHDCAEARPCADRLSTVFISELCTQKSETVGYKKGSSYALQAPSDEQLLYSGCDAAPHRGTYKHHDAAEEYSPKAESIAKGSTDEQQGREEERIGFNDPLHLCSACTKGTLKVRERDIHNSPINEIHTGAEHGRRKYPSA